MDLSGIKKIYCIGIGGIGVSAVARWGHHQGIAVSGSDVTKTDLTEKLKREGIEVFYDHDAAHVPDDADFVVYTPAADEKHVERVAAAKKKIMQVSYPEFLGWLSENKFTIAVTGTHGKSTTTAMLGLMLQEAGFDPTIFVGTIVPGLEHGNVRVGHSNFLVVEACEHQGNMRQISSNIAIVTGIEPDHLDFYKNFEHALSVYQEFVDNISLDGLLVKNYEDDGCAQLEFKGRTMSYGKSTDADVYYSGYKYEDGLSTYHVHSTVEGEGHTVESKLGVPGEFNVENGLAAGIAAYQAGVPGPVINHVSENFSGIWRRFEKVGEYNGALIYSDYGHHPTAIEETMKMVRQLYPKKRVVFVFQPHQHNRTKELYVDFVEVLSVVPVDVLVLNEIYDVAGRKEDKDSDVSSVHMLDEVRKTQRFETHYTATLDETQEWLEENVEPDDVVVIMGAGDIDLVARNLAK